MSDEQQQPEQFQVAQTEQPGDKWGDPISEQRQAELKWLAERQREWVGQPEATRGDSVFKGVQLTGADVLWLAEDSGRGDLGRVPNLRLEGADLRDAHLEGADLSRAHLEGANLEGANLSGAHLQGAYLSSAHFEGAVLVEADIGGTALTEAHLEGANLARASLAGADLRLAFFDRITLLHRSSKAIDEAAPKRPVWWRRTPPDPGAGVAVELGGGDVGHIREILGVG